MRSNLSLRPAQQGQSICVYHCQRSHRKVPITHLKVCCDSKKEIVQFFWHFAVTQQPLYVPGAMLSHVRIKIPGFPGSMVSGRDVNPGPKIPDETGRDKPLYFIEYFSSSVRECGVSILMA